MSLTKLILRKNLPNASRKLLDCGSIVKSITCQKSTNQPSSNSSSSSSDSDDELKKKAPNSDAVRKLNFLLDQMMSNNIANKTSIDLAQPSNKREQGRQEKQEASTQSVENKIINAVQEVADSLGGNVKQTESELLVKLLNPIKTPEETTASLSDILKGMKVERGAAPQVSKAEQVRSALKSVSSQMDSPQRSMSSRRPRRPVYPMGPQGNVEPVALFEGDSLGIFTNPSELQPSSQLSTWQQLHNRELQLAVTHPPSNYFQEMILWTNQGKFWQFPINNEFGLDEESKVYFSEHIFLEKYLEPWCPARGPLRHFMELVCVGLSKNSYLTVEAKREHIEWYKNYFEEKRQLLQEVGAFPAPPKDQPAIDQQ
uniref:Small ribosomal subunit protein mS31 n=1 Tax=Dendroctonus ponderosae TaxID=77166 RepID=A0AAR5PM98_DENPD